MNYQIGDFIIRLKNAAMARRRETILPYSRVNKAIGETLVKTKFLSGIKEEAVDGKKILKATLRYQNRVPKILGVLIISKPSLRVYVKAGQARSIEKKRLSRAFVSTSKGIMTVKEAQKEGVGGELLFEVW